MYDTAISQAALGQLAAKNTYPDKSGSASPFLRVRDADDAVASIEKRVAEMSNRFAGSAPETAGQTSGPHPVLNGMFDDLDEAASNIMGRCERMHMALKRIENRLP